MKKTTYKEKALERDILLFKWMSDSLKLPLNPEFWLTVNGSLGYDRVHDKWVKGTWTGLLDDYGDFTEYVCTTLSSTPETYTLKNHDQVIVCGNTPLYRSFEDERDYYASMKEETDISIDCQLFNSRLNKAFIAENDQQKKQITDAYRAVKKGLPLVVVTKLLENLTTVDLTDPDDIEKMQYLSSFYQTMEKREANDYGIDLESLDKRAQASVEEIKQYKDVTTMEYLTMWEPRQAFMEEMRAAGYDITIVRNPVYYDEPTAEDIDTGEYESAEKEQEQEPEPDPDTEKEDNKDDNENS